MVGIPRYFGAVSCPYDLGGVKYTLDNVIGVRLTLILNGKSVSAICGNVAGIGNFYLLTVKVIYDGSMLVKSYLAFEIVYFGKFGIYVGSGFRSVLTALEGDVLFLYFVAVVAYCHLKGIFNSVLNLFKVNKSGGGLFSAACGFNSVKGNFKRRLFVNSSVGSEGHSESDIAIRRKSLREHIGIAVSIYRYPVVSDGGSRRVLLYCKRLFIIVDAAEYPSVRNGKVHQTRNLIGVFLNLSLIHISEPTRPY